MKPQSKISKKFAHISASTMMWSMDIDATMTSNKKLKLVLVENSVSSRTETDHWEFIEPPYDFISQLGKFFLEGSDWRISGLVPVQITPGTKIDNAYLGICWCETEFEDTSKLLSKLDPDLRKSIYTLFGGFETIELQTIAEPFVADLTPYGDWEEITERFGEASDLAWWKKVSATLKNEQTLKKEALAQAETERIEKTFGTPDLVGDFEKLINEFGDNIPGGYLLHLTAFDAPEPGKFSDTFLLAWGKLKTPVPSNSGSSSVHIGGVSFGEGDLRFAHWILKTNKSEKLARLRNCNEGQANDIFKKLQRIADKGRTQLEKKPSNHAEAAIGMGLAKMRSSLDPET